MDKWQDYKTSAKGGGNVVFSTEADLGPTEKSYMAVVIIFT